MNLAHTHLISNDISGKDYYLLRLSTEYVIIPLSVTSWFIVNSLHTKTVFYSKWDRNTSLYTMDSDGATAHESRLMEQVKAGHFSPLIDNKLGLDTT